MSDWFIVLVQPEGQPPSVKKFSQSRVVIGREIGDLVLADPRCSSTHAELLFDGRTVRLRDLGSTNGTWVGSERVQALICTHGTSFRVGTHTLTIQLPDAVPVAGRGHTVLHDAAAVAEASTALASHKSEPPVALRRSRMQGTPSSRRWQRFPHWIAVAVAVVALGLGGASVLRGAGATRGTGEGPQLSEAQEATVEFVWFMQPSGEKAKGGTSKAKIRVGPNTSGTVSVGVAEEFVHGGGAQWGSAAWMAAFNAARAVHASLADYEFNVHVGGHVDGPSAGMLTTATMIALLRHTSVRTDTTMTGTINPDGTAGPVGGIVQKMEGAHASGLKRFGFPIGVRNHMDMNTRELVDLFATGQRLGLEVKEIADVYEAYEFLTGSTLPRPEPASDADMELDGRTQSLLRAKLKAWGARTEREIGALKQELSRASHLRGAMQPVLSEAGDRLDKAARFERNGYLDAALHSYVEGAALLSMLGRLSGPLTMALQSDFVGLQRAVNNAATIATEAEAYAQQLEVRGQTGNRSVQISTTWAYAFCTYAEIEARIGAQHAQNVSTLIQALAADRLRFTREVQQQLISSIMSSFTWYELARLELEAGRDLQDLISDEGGHEPLSSTSLERMVAGHASGSAAVFEYFRALIFKRFMRPGRSEADAERAIIAQEPEYLITRNLSDVAEGWRELVRRAGERGDGQGGQGQRLRWLAAASSSYLQGNKLVNKYYSLGAHLDAQGKLQLDYRRALTAQLDVARRTARESATRAKATAGFIPTAARLSYQSGDAHREGSDTDKLDALFAYWVSTYWSELAAAK